MNGFLIAGIILGILAAFSTGYGTFLQNKRDSILKEKLNSFVEQESKKNRPLLHVVNAQISNQKEITLFINNSGEQQANETTIVFTFHPNKFIEGMRIILPVIPKGTTRPVTFDIWQENLIKRMPLNDEYKKFLEEYRSNQKALVTYFYVEYKSDETTFKTTEYALLLSSDGVFHFSPLGEKK